MEWRLRTVDAADVWPSLVTQRTVAFSDDEIAKDWESILDVLAEDAAAARGGLRKSGLE